ncbi:hypothetical protein KY284_030386 [Solanum tuberosum]|nr:hypothetical protein KY284_030386 [Solanum tuberosum]
MIESIRYARLGSVPRGFVSRVSSVVLHLEVEIIQARAHRIIRVDQCRPLFIVQMVLMDLALVRPVGVHIVDLKVKEGVQTLVVTLSWVQVPVVVLFVRILGTRKRIALDVLLYCPVKITC